MKNAYFSLDAYICYEILKQYKQGVTVVPVHIPCDGVCSYLFRHADSADIAQFEKMANQTTLRMMKPAIDGANLETLDSLCSEMNTMLYENAHSYALVCFDKRSSEIIGYPDRFSYGDLRTCLVSRHTHPDLKTPQAYAALVKRAVTYQQCKDLLDNVLPENEPYWRACDRKAQRLLGLGGCEN